MSNSKLEINVKHQSAAAARGGGVTSAAAARGAQGGSSQAARQGPRMASNQVRATQQLSRTMDAHLRETRNLSKQMKQSQSIMTRLTQGIQKLHRAMLRGGGRGGGGAAGAGIGRMGAGIGFGVGALFGAAGFLLSKVKQVGEAHLAAAVQQKTTAGVGGFSVGQGQFTGAEMGEFRKQRMLESGAGSLTGSANKSRAMAGTQTALNYAGIFGKSPAEVAKTIGLADIQTGGQGGQAVASVLRTGAKGGMGTELPVMMQALSSTLEDAVRDGVKDAGLPEALAKEMVGLSKETDTGQFRSMQGAIQSLRGIQKGISTGSFSGSVASSRMFFAGERLLQDKNVFAQLKAEKGSTASQIIGGAKSAEELTGGQRKVLSQILQRTQGAKVRREMLRELAQTFGSTEGESVAKARAQFIDRAQATAGLQMTPQQLNAFYNRSLRDRAKSIGKQIEGSDTKRQFDVKGHADAVRKRDQMVARHEEIKKQRGIIGNVVAGVRQLAGEKGREAEIEKMNALIKKMEEVKRINAALGERRTMEQAKEEAGKRDSTRLDKGIEGNRATAAAIRSVRLETLRLGKTAAQASEALIQVEKGLIKIANAGAGPASAALDKIGTFAEKLAKWTANMIPKIEKFMKLITKKGGLKSMLGDLLKDVKIPGLGWLRGG